MSDYTTCRVVVHRFRSPCYRKLHESLNLEMADCEESLMCMANGKQQGRTVSVERSTTLTILFHGASYYLALPTTAPVKDATSA